MFAFIIVKDFLYHILVVDDCEALYSYDANQEDELTLEPGDTIDIIDKTDENWWHGQHRSTGQVGIFPASYVNASHHDKTT